MLRCSVPQLMLQRNMTDSISAAAGISLLLPLSD